MSCKHCGKCCSRFFLLHKYEGDVQKAIDGINMHKGMLVIGRKDDHLIVAIDAPCKHLIEGDVYQGEVWIPYECEIYESRPEGCRNYYCSKCEE